ncbi:MAG TPA: FmdB family zinc ribbon protein [Acidimicrobiales bacterium]|nr:FmdB family zinc ribbon protein [Acidimicrobiales bacterium]
MPTYEYVCKSCGDSFEVTRAFTDSALTTCTACGGQLRKVYGSIGIVLKGGGFYRTENRTNRSASSASNNGSSADKTVPDSAASVPVSKKESPTKDSDGSTSTSSVTAKPAAKS